MRSTPYAGGQQASPVLLTIQHIKLRNAYSLRLTCGIRKKANPGACCVWFFPSWIMIIKLGLVFPCDRKHCWERAEHIFSL